MNPIQKAIMDVKYKIPPQILQAAFVHREFGHRPIPYNVDALIRDRVIDARVLVDCNLVGGQQVVIPLINVVPEYLDPTTVIYRIPKALTQGRMITRALSMSVGAGSAAAMGLLNNTNGYAYSGLEDAADAVAASHNAIPMVSTAYIRIIAENTIMVTEQVALPSNISLRCMLEYDPDLTQLKPTSFPKFSRLVELAVKAYIHNELIIPMGQGQLSGGMELGRFREVIDSYADSNELYDTYLQETWRKVALLDDATSRERHLRIIAGARR